MLVALYTILIICSYTNATTAALTENNDECLISCVTQIIKHYYKRKIITYVDINYNGNEIIKIINSLPATVISRDGRKNLGVSNIEYVITSGSPDDFIRNFQSLRREPRWNPYAVFLIVVKYVKTKKLHRIFDLLLKSHVNNVVLVNGTNTADVYTYNPFDNYNCGKKYNNIINLGNCLNPVDTDLYPDKLVTGFRNCTFNAATSDWPPYSVNLTNSDETGFGVEQYVFEIISKLEGFTVQYSKSIDGEEFSTIGDNMSASGNLLMLQAKETDVIFGGMMLVDFRADAFNFVCGHLPFMDDLRILVQKAGPVTFWKNLFLEFQTTVWLVLVIAFLGYFILLIVVLRGKDKTSIFLVMIDFFFLHGNRMVTKSRGVFIIWVIFAYLINTYYQSSLVSIMANPINNYQISSNEDLMEYNAEPCISTVLQKYLMIVQRKTIGLNYKEGCTSLIESIRSVSRTNKKYTVSLYSIYLYNKYLFYNEEGQETIYAFKSPMNRVIYAIYFYRGFPMQERLNLHAIRLRENGLVDRYLERLYYMREKHFRTTTYRSSNSMRLIFPWYILVLGIIVAIGIFILELFSKRNAE